MDSALAQMDFETARALYEWQVELGVDEAIGDDPVNRYEAEAERHATEVQAAMAARPAAPSAPPQPEPVDAAAAAAVAAARAATLEDLASCQGAFDLCDLKKGARNFVFADGNPEARVMIIGEAPGRDEDIEGRPFVGRAGQLLDRMFAAIGLSRVAHHPDEAIYITNIMPWRPPQNRDPEAAEIAMMLPFVQRHVELARPDLIVLMGNTACAAALGKRGITRLRGNWTQAFDRPALPMNHPAHLLRTPSAKREAWADLLSLKAKLNGLP
ncbi:MAG: uracil-DNA glycosylase [Rhodobacteraceae bacterium]|uniref:uracil-DNA glycosylase n=1 Tax=Albidovulum sp. TaxID=1872424 RepID=UPI001DB873D4|nr:uracil-DNA glycosylase [Paracoccaceae bacterium]MCB2123357.1 uracil-DNA glycosylase [Paracoccaceae bacterium]MCB2152011.1 uracil-DNA glycosylase [Paracoccaceae bacterium]HRV64583.1 uracil-DNA glycosylase [Albidovulum sp.]